MKRCPSCQRTYADDAQAFCFTDGTRLLEEGQAYDSQRTLVAPPPQGQFEQPPQYNPQGRQTGPTSPYETRDDRSPSWPQPSGQSGQQPWPSQPQPPQQTPSWGEQPQYQQQGAPYMPASQPSAQSKRRNLAVTALVFSLLAIQDAVFLMFRWFMIWSSIRAVILLFGLLGILLGAVALTLSFVNSARHAGRAAAVIAIITSFLAMALALIR